MRSVAASNVIVRTAPWGASTFGGWWSAVNVPPVTWTTYTGE
jgi:hypothetical protein